MDNLSEILLIISIPVFITAIVFGIIFLIKKVAKKPTKTGTVAKWLFIATLALLVAFILFSEPESALTLISTLLVVASLVLLIISVIRKIRKKKSKKTWIACASTFVLGIALVVISNASWMSYKNDPVNYEVTVKTDYDFEVKDGDTPIEVKTSDGFNTGVIEVSYRHVYDVCDLGLVLDETDPTAEMCLEAIANNDGLSKEYKDYFSDFVRRIDSKYPDANLAVLYDNLKTLKVVELSGLDYNMKSLSLSSLGCYFNSENTIYVPTGTRYIEGEFGFQVLIHEFCHAARTRWREEDGINKQIQFKTLSVGGSDNTLVEETLNSAFSCSLLNYYEWDIAYQVPSNYLRIMLECMDNYELSDYINHSDFYFLKKLDEYNGDTNYAQIIWDLISVQRNDCNDDTIDIPKEEFYPIYEYLCDMYYGKYLDGKMSEAERIAVADELVYKAFFDAPENYKIDKQFFYDYLDEYAKENLPSYVHSVRVENENAA